MVNIYYYPQETRKAPILQNVRFDLIICIDLACCGFLVFLCLRYATTLVVDVALASDVMLVVHVCVTEHGVDVDGHNAVTTTEGAVGLVTSTFTSMDGDVGVDDVDVVDSCG